MEAEPPKRKRRWCQFSLRTLMIVMVIVAIPCAWLGKKIDRKRREREIVSSIEALKGRVLFDYQEWPANLRSEPFGPAWLRSFLGDDFFSEIQLVDFVDCPVADSQLISLRELPHLKRLWLTRTKVTDYGLAILRDLSELQTLDLSQTDITDAGLANLKQLTGVQQLLLAGTKITDAGLVNLKDMAQMTHLNLDGTHVTDAGLAKLASMRELQTLDLGGTRITDRGLGGLKELSRLHLLILNDTDVTDGGVSDFQMALPHCTIYPL